MSNSPPDRLRHRSEKCESKSGCHVTTATGVGLALIAIQVAVGTGLIVFYTARDRKFVCRCGYPEPEPPSPPPGDQWGPCERLLRDRGHCVSSICPIGNSTPGQNAPVTMATQTPPTDTRFTKVTLTDSTTRKKLPVAQPSMRLPTSLIPVHYSLELEPRIYEGSVENFTCLGSVDISMNCVEASQRITLHAKRLTIVNSSVSLVALNGTPAPGIVNYDFDHANSFILFNLNGKLSSGNSYRIKMDFVSKFVTRNFGLFLREYQQDNHTVYVMASQMAPEFARLVFPCFDEPALKATYDVTLVRRNDYSSLFNMPKVKSEPRGNNMTADVFQTSVKMSTYLLAFVVSQFSHKQALTARGVRIGVWSRPDVTDQAEYALHLAVKVMDYFEEFYNIRYPLPKMDMLAVSEFPFGGMENWGLLIHDEASMLHEPGVTTAKSFLKLTNVVTHEIAHQWFGNMVTCRWWDDIWLNEGFATFDHYRGVNHMYPHWKMWEVFVVDKLQDALRADGAVSSHPLNFLVDNRVKIYKVYDHLPYSKGASILRMLEHFLGEETFKQGVKRYLAFNLYNTVTYVELAESLEGARGGPDGGITIREIMEAWILQMNYPVVTITRSADHAFTVSQARFVLNPDEEESEKFSSPYGYKWDIPFTFTTNLEKDFNTTRTYVMRKDEGMAEISDSSVIPEWNNNYNWVIGNVRQVGFYRVNYDTTNWMALIRQLNEDHTVISPENRAQIINDAWNLAKANLTDFSIAFGAIRYLEQEESYAPWKAAVAEMEYADRQLSGTAIYGSFKKYMRVLVRKQYLKIGWGERQKSELDPLLQDIIVTLACRYHVPECVTDARRMFAVWMAQSDSQNTSVLSSTSSVPPMLKDVMYCTTIAHGDKPEVNFALQMYQKDSALRTSLSCSKDIWILLWYLSITPDDPSHHLTSNPEGLTLLWEFIQRHWEELPSKLRRPELFTAIVSIINSESDLSKIKQFLSDHDLTERGFQMALETAAAQTAWMENNIPTITKFFEEQKLA